MSNFPDFGNGEKRMFASSITIITGIIWSIFEIYQKEN